jgi:hypothetical protein
MVMDSQKKRRTNPYMGVSKDTEHKTDDFSLHEHGCET